MCFHGCFQWGLACRAVINRKSLRGGTSQPGPTSACTAVLGFQTLDSKFLSEQTHNSNSPGSFQAFGTGPDCIIDQPFCVLRLPDQWTEQQLASLPLQCPGGYHWVTPSPIIQAIDRNLCMCYITGSFLLVNSEGMIVMAYIQLILMDELENWAKE